MTRDIFNSPDNFNLYISWLGARISYEQILAWAAIAIMSAIVLWMARYTIKHF